VIVEREVEKRKAPRKERHEFAINRGKSPLDDSKKKRGGGKQHSKEANKQGGLSRKKNKKPGLEHAQEERSKYTQKHYSDKIGLTRQEVGGDYLLVRWDKNDDKGPSVGKENIFTEE